MSYNYNFLLKKMSKSFFFIDKNNKNIYNVKSEPKNLNTLEVFIYEKNLSTK